MYDIQLLVYLYRVYRTGLNALFVQIYVILLLLLGHCLSEINASHQFWKLL